MAADENRTTSYSCFLLIQFNFTQGVSVSQEGSVGL